MVLKMNKYKCFIFARGGSQTIKNKNIKIICGKPLIYWTIKFALEHKRIDDVIVSTDSIKIAEIASKYGAKVPFLRPKKYSNNNSSELSAWKHILNFYKKQNIMPQEFISLPTTAPLRKTKDINRCMDLYESKKLDGVVTIIESKRSPYFNLLKNNNKNYLETFSTKKIFYNRQDNPKTYDLLTVAYIYNSNFVLKTDSILKGKIEGVLIDESTSLDIDTMYDFKLASYLLHEKQYI